MTPPALADAAVVTPSFAGGLTDASQPVPRATSWAVDVSRLTRPRIAVMVLATVVTALWLTGGRPESLATVAVLLAMVLICPAPVPEAMRT